MLVLAELRLCVYLLCRISIYTGSCLMGPCTAHQDKLIIFEFIMINLSWCVVLIFDFYQFDSFLLSLRFFLVLPLILFILFVRRLTIRTATGFFRLLQVSLQDQYQNFPVRLIQLKSPLQRWRLVCFHINTVFLTIYNSLL